MTSERSGLIVADRVEPGRKAVPWGRRNRFRRPILSLSPDRSPASGPRPGVRDDSQRIYLPGSVRSFEEWTVDGGRWTEFLHCPPSTVHFLPPCPILPLAAYFAGPIVTVIGPPPRIRQRRVNRRGRHNRYAACGLIEPRQGCLSMTALLVKLPNVGNLYQYGQGRGCTPGPRSRPGDWPLATLVARASFIRGGISPRRGPRPRGRVCRRPPAQGVFVSGQWTVHSGRNRSLSTVHCPPYHQPRRDHEDFSTQPRDPRAGLGQSQCRRRQFVCLPHVWIGPTAFCGQEDARRIAERSGGPAATAGMSTIRSYME